MPQNTAPLVINNHEFVKLTPISSQALSITSTFHTQNLRRLSKMESQQKQSPFFKIPLELRRNIYNMLVPPMNLNGHRVCGSEKLKQPGRLADYPPIMHTCKKAFRDARPVMCREVYITIEGITWDVVTFIGFGRLYPEYLHTLSVVYHLSSQRPGVPEALEWIAARAPFLKDVRLSFQNHPRTCNDTTFSGISPVECETVIARREARRLRYMIPLLWFIDSIKGLQNLRLDGIYPRKTFVRAVKEVLANRDQKVKILARPSEYTIDE
ncbi:hypothetical protein F5X99DRAFT_19117 [Biscogniauxia marginata]|nr:hypothetical protein F5X99DRAFT_19117 [Biscogniauxia marginata]